MARYKITPKDWRKEYKSAQGDDTSGDQDMSIVVNL